MNGFNLQEIYEEITLLINIDSICFRTWQLKDKDHLVVSITQGMFRLNNVWGNVEKISTKCDYIKMKCTEMANKFNKELGEIENNN